MPTPVGTARQCLTEEAARALDDAVTVARRRSHAQTTSLHAVSALLALPSSTLREACARARSSAYSPRLQFRALELSVGVSLDRLPTTKAQDEPPISNSLMAAIKRSQANQRRHPETFHLYQQLQHQNNIINCNNTSSSSPPSISTVKVELKHFMLSILDDPIVSKVFGEAGFRSFDIKMAILNPPNVSRYSKARCPPLFLCNLSDLELSKRGFSFPFSGALANDSLDENSRRIGEVLVKKTGKNPLLVGVCADGALHDFTDVVKKGKVGILGREIDGLGVVCLEKEISEFLQAGGNEEMMRFKFKEVDDLVKANKGNGLLVSYGELKAFVGDEESGEAVNYVVSQLSRLVEVHCGKLWLIGCAASYDTYMKLLGRFPSIEKDWDLHLVPITSSKPLVGGVYSRPGLMGSFVPFGGFFSTPSDYENPWSIKNQPMGRCNVCNQKCEVEASVIQKGGSTISVADQCSANLSPWLQIMERDKNKRLGVEEAKDDRTDLNAKLLALEKKWNDICKHLHQKMSFQQNISEARLQVPKADTFQFVSARSESSITDSLLDERKPAKPNSCMPLDLQPTSLPKLNIVKQIPHDAFADSPAESPAQGLQTGNFLNPYGTFHNLGIALDQTTSSSITSVTTDLGLGTLYTSALEEPTKPIFQEYKDCLDNSGSVSANTSSENTSNHVAQSSPCSVPPSDGNDFKYIWRVLSEKVGWQDKAVYTIHQTVASCRNGHGKRHGSNKGNIWLSFLGPDKVGKRRIAAALAEAIFGRRESLFQVDLCFIDKVRRSSTIFDREDLKGCELNFRGKTMVDYIAEELSKKSHSVVLLENIDKADFLLQNSLSQAIRSNKFPNSHGREISLNNMIFVFTSRVSKGCDGFLSGQTSTEFSEERILAAKDVQMQISVGCDSADVVRVKSTNLMITSKKQSASLSAGKRKLSDDLESAENRMLPVPKRKPEATRSSFDLNMPVEEMEQDNDCNSSDYDSGSENTKGWLEDFLDQMDENVAFKPFDFDALAQKVLKEISLGFQKIVGSNFRLEIESEIVVQILAAAWLSERKKAVEDWIEGVLCTSFKEALQRCTRTPVTVNVMKLIACEDLLVEDHSALIRLPSRLTIS
ncbi:protein SMAX1-LIKE 6 [Coffea eugenioides]|uniref:protein SMAX1-LIKE 6 n=1 Tax=Coffea eugenioides TaxID=49369 RepID=UPI000F60A4FA|nr:protein SMAX1-LIKE 6 [Coffea eugenioides]